MKRYTKYNFENLEIYELASQAIGSLFEVKAGLILAVKLKLSVGERLMEVIPLIDELFFLD